MKIQTSLAKLFLSTVLIVIANRCTAQSSSMDSLLFKDLARTISAMDSTFFDAFNTCNIEKSQSLFTDDLEFYHDRGGLTTYSQNVNSIKSRCKGKTKVRRELVQGSLEVHPIKDFGAIQIGSHRFYYTEEGKSEKLEGTFKFVHVWKLKNGVWKISRVISYDHGK